MYHYGGRFKPKDTNPEEVERARVAAVESRRKLEERYFIIKQSEGPDLSCPVERKSDVVGVRWCKHRCAWLVRAQKKGDRIIRYIYSERNTPKDIEHARLIAIKCLENWKCGICMAASLRSTG